MTRQGRKISEKLTPGVLISESSWADVVVARQQSARHSQRVMAFFINEHFIVENIND